MDQQTSIKKDVPSKFEEFRLATEKEIQEFKEETKMQREKDLEGRKSNENKYYELKQAGLLDKLKGYYVAISKDGIIGFSEDPNEITKFVLEDSTVFTTRVGDENSRFTRTFEILVLLDLKSPNSKIRWPYHQHEGKVVRGNTKKWNGWCGDYRPYCALVVRYNPSFVSGVLGTFLLDTGSPVSMIHEELFLTIKPLEVEHTQNIYKVSIFGKVFEMVVIKRNNPDTRVEGINLLGSNTENTWVVTPYSRSRSANHN